MDGLLERVILVDDDADDRELFAEAVSLVHPHIRIEVKRDGEELMEHLRTADTAPDVIFLDLNMPKKNGRECLEEIIREKSCQCTQVVIYTTSLNPLDVEETYRGGAARFVRKPSSFEGLKEILHKLLSDQYFEEVGRTKENFVVNL